MFLYCIVFILDWVRAKASPFAIGEFLFRLAKHKDYAFAKVAKVRIKLCCVCVSSIIKIN